MNILVTGGAGYIGSNMVRMLTRLGHVVTVLDTLEFGKKSALPLEVTLIVGDCADEKILTNIFEKTKFAAVIHFAGYLSVAESVRDPRKYFSNNVIGPVALLEAMEKFGVRNLIFSSTAAVYGNPMIVPIPESHPKNPTNPYGLTKWCFEELLRVYDRKQTIRSISLRYFNAAGASLDGLYGEVHDPETHIIPVAMQTALGMRSEFMIFGSDYPTPDGTCLRDYIHVEDLCQAHIVAFDALLNGHETTCYNVGTGMGVSNRQIVELVKKIAGIDFKVTQKGRRKGDPHTLIADASRIRAELGWKDRYSEIATIINSAWAWHKAHPKGYENRN